MDMLKVDDKAEPESETAKTWKKWMTRIEGRRKVFENGWWKQAENAERMYNVPADSTPEFLPFNILYANTEVLLPSLYSASPRPDVAMRNKQAQDQVAQAAEAYLTTFIDMNVPGRETFDDSVEGTVLSSLVSGAGFVRLRVYQGEPCPVRTEGGTYKELIWGKAQRWNRVPWATFVHTMVKEDVVEQFHLNPAQAAKLKIDTQEDADERRDRKTETFYVYELWIRATKQIVWLCDGYEDVLLEPPSEDVLKLPGFFPTPGPLSMVRKPGTIDPTPIYEYYRNQAEELNRVTIRLNKVLSAIKVRGVYNNLLGDAVKELLQDTSSENSITPTQNGMDLMGKGFEGHIWFMPIAELISVAKELYSARVQIMSVIQQITGLSDIVRGSTVASETATAQDLKNKWGTIRLRRMQRTVQLYVRDLLRMSINIAANVLEEETWKQVTQLPFPTSEQKAQAGQKLQEMMAMQQQQAEQYQMAAQSAQAQGLPPESLGPAPQPQSPDPQLLQIVQAQSWGEIIGTLRDDGGRSYTIDIETASTIDTDATADREEVTDFLGAMAQYVAAAAPLVQLGPTGMNVVKEMLIAVCAKFKFGREVKESIEKLEAPQPGNDPEAKAKMAEADAKLQMQREKHQMDMTMAQEKNKMEKEKMDRQAQLDLLKFQLEKAKLEQEVQMMPMKLDMERQQHQMDMETAQVQQQTAREGVALDRQAQQDKATFTRQSLQDKAKFQKGQMAQKAKSKPTS